MLILYWDKMKRILFLIIIFLCLANSISASTNTLNWYINDIYMYPSDARILGMGGIYTAIPASPEYVYYNPAFIAHNKEYKLYIPVFVDYNTLTEFSKAFQNLDEKTTEYIKNKYIDDYFKKALDGTLTYEEASAYSRELHLKIAEAALIQEIYNFNILYAFNNYAISFFHKQFFILTEDMIPSPGLFSIPDSNLDAVVVKYSGLTFSSGLIFNQYLSAGLSLKLYSKINEIEHFDWFPFSLFLTAYEDSDGIHIAKELDKRYFYMKEKSVGIGIDSGLLFKISGFRIGLGLRDFITRESDGFLHPKLNPGISYFRDGKYVDFLFGIEYNNLLYGRGLFPSLETYDDIGYKTSVGLELAFFNLLSFRAGAYCGYPTLGAGIRIYIFEFDYAYMHNGIHNNIDFVFDSPLHIIQLKFSM